MSKSSRSDKLDISIVPPAKKELDEVPETSFIRNIQIDVPEAEPSATPRDPSFVSNTGTGALRSLTPRTTTLALDPRPYRRRERMYTTIITILAITVLLQAGLLLLNDHKTSRVLPASLITIAGVENNRHTLEKLATDFMHKYPGTLVKLTTENEQSALADLAQGQTDIAQMSYPLSEADKTYLAGITGKPVQQVFTKRTALAIYVHKDNPIEALTLEQLAAIYRGEIDNWQTLGGPNMPILAYGSSYLLGSHRVFEEQVMHNQPWLTTILLANEAAQMVQHIANSNNAIGYGDAFETLPASVRLVKIRKDQNATAVMPLTGNSLNDSYPLIHNVYWYTVGVPEGSLKTFLDSTVLTN